MPKKGQSVKFDTTKKERFLELLRNGGRRGASAKAVGVHRATVVDHMKADEGFAEAVSEAEMEANELVENALFSAALKGNVTAIQVWLYNRWGERWADRRKQDAALPSKPKGPLVIMRTRKEAEEERADQASGD